MRRFLMQGGRYGPRGRPRFGLAAASLGLVVAVTMLFSFNRGEPKEVTHAVPGSAPRAAVALPAEHQRKEATAGLPAAPAKPEPAIGPSAPGGDRPVQALPGPRPGAMIRPVDGDVIARHGWIYSRTMEDWRWHPGLDIAAPAGTTVKASAAGRVKAVRQSKEWGWEVTVEHGAGVVTRYAGCREILVKPGQQVVEGETVAAVGDGALAEVENGPHLHFETLVDGQPVDPQRYLR